MFENDFEISDETLKFLQDGAIAEPEEDVFIEGSGAISKISDIAIFNTSGTTFTITTTSASTSGDWFVVNGTDADDIEQTELDEMRETINNLRVKFFDEKYNTLPPWPYNCHAPIPPEEYALQQLMQ